MKVTATQQIEVELSNQELSYALMRWALEQYGLAGTDDAGCDWMTDDAGNTYISGADWRVSTVPAFAALVDAANQMRYGKRLIVTPIQQATMFPDGEDTPLFTQPEAAPAEPQIEFTFRSMSPHNLDIANDCIDYAWPKNTVAGCWAHLDKLLARGTIPQAQYDEIKAGGDFIIAD